MAHKTIPAKMVVQHGIEVHTDEDGSLQIKAGEQKLDLPAGKAERLYELIGDVIEWTAEEKP